MDRFNVKPGPGRKIFAAMICTAAISEAITGPLSARLIATGLLIAAYDLAFTPSPPFNRSLGEIYAMARQGWRMSWTSKILSAICWILLIAGFYLQWHRR